MESIAELEDVVLAAVTQNGDALRFAAAHLKAVLEIVVATVRQNGSALWYAASKIQADVDAKRRVARF